MIKLPELLNKSVDDLAVMAMNAYTSISSLKDQYHTLYTKYTTLKINYTADYYQISKDTHGRGEKTNVICTANTFLDAIKCAVKEDHYMGELCKVKSAQIDSIAQVNPQITLEVINEYNDKPMVFHWSLTKVKLFRAFTGADEDLKLIETTHQKHSLPDLLQIPVDELAKLVDNLNIYVVSIKEQFSTLYNKHSALKDTFTQDYYQISKGTIARGEKTHVLCTVDTIKEAAAYTIDNDPYMGQFLKVDKINYNEYIGSVNTAFLIEARHTTGLMMFNWSLAEIHLFREVSEVDKDLD
jgi:hypothetical protein